MKRIPAAADRDQNATAVAAIVAKSKRMSTKAIPGLSSPKNKHVHEAFSSSWTPKSVSGTAAPVQPASLPNQPSGDGHAEIQRRPHRAENPVGRVPAWLCQGCVPVVDLRAGDDPADRRYSKADGDQHDQAEPRMFRKCCGHLVSPRRSTWPPSSYTGRVGLASISVRIS